MADAPLPSATSRRIGSPARPADATKQLAFGLPRCEAFGRADFFISDGNAAALEWVDRWPHWPSPVLMLYGPSGSGKTHLAQLWRERAQASLFPGGALGPAQVESTLQQQGANIVVDDCDKAPSVALLHLFNACAEVGGSLLLTARRPPAEWRLMLPDLGSRLRATPAVGMDLPDDALLGAVLVKHFADRQLRVAGDVISYLVSHMERSLAEADAIAAALDQAALQRQGPVSMRLAKEILALRGVQFVLPEGDPGVT